MRFKALATLGLATALALCGSDTQAQVDGWVGRWRNVDSRTRDIPLIVIPRSGQTVQVHPFGACHPSYCDWGVAPAHLYAHTVSQSALADTAAITANFDNGFNLVELVITRRGDTLHFATYTTYKDSSRRQDHMNEGDLVRE